MGKGAFLCLLEAQGGGPVSAAGLGGRGVSEDGRPCTARSCSRPWSQQAASMGTEPQVSTTGDGILVQLTLGESRVALRPHPCGSGGCWSIRSRVRSRVALQLPSARPVCMAPGWMTHLSQEAAFPVHE